MTLGRHHALDLVQLELECLTGHLTRLDFLVGVGGMAEWAGGVQQLKAAITRFESDVAATPVRKP